MASCAPSTQPHPEDAYMHEIDNNAIPSPSSGLPWVFTERAIRAQNAKIARLLNLFQPRPILTPEEVGPQFRDGHRLAYGWAFSSDDLMKYAELYKLRQPLQKYLSGKLGKSFVTYGALSETEAQDADLHLYLTEAVVISVRRDLEERAGVKLLSVIPFSRAYHHLFALYTNVEVNRRMEEIEEAVGLEYVLDAIDDAIAGVGIQAEALWWYDSLTLRGVDLSYPC